VGKGALRAVPTIYRHIDRKWWAHFALPTLRFCQARGHHGFNGIDAQVVGLAASFR